MIPEIIPELKLIQNEKTRHIENSTLAVINLDEITTDELNVIDKNAQEEGTPVYEKAQNKIKNNPLKQFSTRTYRTKTETINECKSGQVPEVVNLRKPLVEKDTNKFFDIIVDGLRVDCFLSGYHPAEWKMKKMYDEYISNRKQDKAEYILVYKKKDNILVREGCYFWLTDEIKEYKRRKLNIPVFDEGYYNAMAELEAM